jgi:methionyl-tRNA formyltransferase
LRLVFAGTPAFAVPALEALSRAGHDLALVLTQPDRPAGRGQRETASAVAQAAEKLGLPVAKPASLRTPEALDLLHDVAPDVMVVAAYGLLLPQAVLDVPRLGCLNIHASLLPRWRGAAPVHRAILAGDLSTGVAIMRMEAGLDTGPVLLERSLPIGPQANTGSLTGELARLGAEAIVEALAQLETLVPRPQAQAGVTYASKVEKPEARIDWQRPAVEIDRQVRAFNPSPGAEASVRGLPLKIWEARAVEGGDLAPGEPRIEAGKLFVGCGSGALEVLVLQRPGGRRMSAVEFLRGNPWAESAASKAST